VFVAKKSQILYLRKKSKTIRQNGIKNKKMKKKTVILADKPFP